MSRYNFSSHTKRQKYKASNLYRLKKKLFCFQNNNYQVLNGIHVKVKCRLDMLFWTLLTKSREPFHIIRPTISVLHCYLYMPKNYTSYQTKEISEKISFGLADTVPSYRFSKLLKVLNLKMSIAEQRGVDCKQFLPFK